MDLDLKDTEIVSDDDEDVPGSQPPPPMSFITRKDDEFLNWHKVNVYGKGCYEDPKEILFKIQDELGFPLKYYVWNKLSENIFEFYIKGRALANSIGAITLDGITFKANQNSQNPPTAKISSKLKEKMTTELISRYNSGTGHLNLSNFAESNSLHLEYWLPLNKPIIRCAVNEIIMLSDKFKNMTSVDVSFNKLTQFEDLDFILHKNITILIANDNDIKSIRVLEPFKELLLTELDLQNNPIEPPRTTPEEGEPSQPLDFNTEIKKMFPTLVVLNPEPFGPTKRHLVDSSEDPPNKIAKGDGTEESNNGETSSINNIPRMMTTSHIISLERQLTEAFVQVKNLSVFVHDVSRRQRKTENYLKRIQKENLMLKMELDKFKRWQEKQYKNLNQTRSQQHPQGNYMPQQHQQQQYQPSNYQQQQPRMRPERPERPINYNSYEPLSSMRLAQAPTRVTNYDLDTMRRRQPESSSPSSSSETLDDLSHLFDRPRRS